MQSNSTVKDGDIEQSAFRLAFDGEALASHTIDARDLSTSLSALADIFDEANRILNGKETKVELRVTPDTQAKCFDIGLEIIQQWNNVKELLGNEDIVAAKELIEWTLLGAGGSFASVKSVLHFYKKVLRKKIDRVEKGKEEGRHYYTYFFSDGTSVTLEEKLHKLCQSKGIKFRLKSFLSPVINKIGIDKVTAYSTDKENGNSVDKAQAREFNFDIEEDIETPEPEGPDLIEILRPYSPVYDATAPKWRLWLGKQHYYMDVTASNIRDIAIQNGGALMNDKFQARIKKIPEAEDKGGKAAKYKVFEVLNFFPAERQIDLFRGQETSD